MKVTAILFAAVLAVASVNAVALPEAEAEPRLQRWCYRPGMPCWKAKRAAEAVAEPEPAAEAEPRLQRWCYRPGMPCWKAKRGLQDLHEELSAGLEDN